MLSNSMLFVEPYLNFYGLEPYTFRLFAHIARRSQKQECTSSLDKMAVVCRTGYRKVQDALDKLHQLQLISKKSRYRETSVYRVNQNIEHWTKSEGEDDIKDTKLKEFITLEREKSFLEFKNKLDKPNSPEYKVIYVHGYLDLYGLDPYAFRILAYIASRKKCSDSLKMIAAICKISSRKVQTTLKYLEEQRLISKHEDRGKSNTYQIAPIRNWEKPLENWENKRALARLNKKHGAKSDKVKEYKNKQEKYKKELKIEMEKVRNSSKIV